MKKFFYLFLIILFCIGCTTTKFIEDSYSGMNETEILKKLGAPDYTRLYFVDLKYEFVSEIEPDYIRYFSRESLENGVKVKELFWKKNKKNIYVWEYIEESKIEVFSSLIYANNVSF